MLFPTPAAPSSPSRVPTNASKPCKPSDGGGFFCRSRSVIHALLRNGWSFHSHGRVLRSELCQFSTSLSSASDCSISSSPFKSASRRRASTSKRYRFPRGEGTEVDKRSEAVLERTRGG